MKDIPMLDLYREYEYMKADIDAAINKCLEHQRWILGPEVKEFEAKVARYLNVKHCIGTSSGTDALVLSLRALAIQTKGQEYFDRTEEIITTPFTFTATGDAVLRSGARPAFVDIDPSTYNIDPRKVREYLNRNAMLPPAERAKVIGIIPVHLYGQSCDMDEIMNIAEKYNLFVVEDVAQAFGGMWKGKKLGSVGTTGAFSFFPSKNLGGFGDGGMITTNDDAVAELDRMLLKHGGKDKYNVDHIGYNARIDTLQAAVILAKLGYIDEFNTRRRNIAALYDEALKEIGETLLILPKSLPDAYHVYHQYTVNVSGREDLQSYLKGKGVASMVYYPFPLHKMKVFGEGRCSVAHNLENAEAAAKRVVSLPIEPLQTEEHSLYVAHCVRDFFKQ